MACALTEIVPQLPVKDMAAALDYYQSRMGFHLDWTYGGHFAAVSRGPVRVFLSLADPGFESAVCNLYVDDVDALHAEWSARGVRVLSAPDDKPWGVREMAVEDGDEHLFRVHTLLDTHRREPPPGAPNGG